MLAERAYFSASVPALVKEDMLFSKYAEHMKHSTKTQYLKKHWRIHYNHCIMIHHVRVRKDLVT